MGKSALQSILHKLLALVVLAKVYSGYKSKVYGLLLYGNPVTTLFRSIVNARAKDTASIIPSIR